MNVLCPARTLDANSCLSPVGYTPLQLLSKAGPQWVPSWKNNDRASQWSFHRRNPGILRAHSIVCDSAIQLSTKHYSIPFLDQHQEVGSLSKKKENSGTPLWQKSGVHPSVFWNIFQEYDTILGASTCYVYPAYDGIITKAYEEENKFRDISRARKRGSNFCQEAGMKQPLWCPSVSNRLLTFLVPKAKQCGRKPRRCTEFWKKYKRASSSWSTRTPITSAARRKPLRNVIHCSMLYELKAEDVTPGFKSPKKFQA